MPSVFLYWLAPLDSRYSQ